ncbi:PAC2 family protein [Bifidobacterium sp. ESL0763]|uniref:PAC2 family protein n=1 Tax=Bifidobacterium sp. ESL0763 TaxID=2983227 RepID=UPI0023F6C85E|nr:PAC2 family protein [Bifidobacterium sp. ESL0763]MDF7663833.1 PAC2 family protein [Bifidobacterium sp. ESL0763]
MTEQSDNGKSVMVCAFEGWNDACQAATNVIRHLLSHYEYREVRQIRSDGFYDYQLARPMICHVTGSAKIVWPKTRFYEISVAPGLRVFAQIAPEPNYRWMEYTRRSLNIADELDVDEIVTLGSMYADCPHTRPLPVEQSALRRREDSIRGAGVRKSGSCDCNPYDGPVGIPTVIDTVANEEGFDTTAMWVSVPKYLGGDECAQGTLQILRQLSDLLGVTLNEADLADKARQWKAQASVLISCNDDLAAYVSRLENQYDLNEQMERLRQSNEPQSEQIAREAEAFLEHMND